MDEERKRLWDVWLGILGPILTVVGLLVGVWQFNRGEHNRVILENELVTKKDQVDFQRRLWQNRLETYRSLITLVGKIVAQAAEKGPKDPALDSQWQELTAAYWSQSIFVENDDVAGHLKDFYTTVRDFREGWANSNALKLKANALVQICRQSIEGTAPAGAKP